MYVSGVSACVGGMTTACAAMVASMRLCMSSSIFITSIGDPAGPMLSASHRGVVACVMLVFSGSCLAVGCSCSHSGTSLSIGVCSVLSDLAWRTAGGSGLILLLGVTGRLALVMALLLSEVGLPWRAGFGSSSMDSSALVGRGSDVADGGDIGVSCRLSRSGCLEGPLIFS